MARSRNGPVIAVAALVILAALWFLIPWGSEESNEAPLFLAADRLDVEDEPDHRSHREPLPLGMERDPMVADVRMMARPQIVVLSSEADAAPSEIGTPLLIVPAEPVDLNVLVESAMRDVLATLCRRADECCPGAEVCDLRVLEAMPMDEVGEDMVKKAGEGASMDEQALDDCLVALRDFSCEADFTEHSRARCRTDDGTTICDEIPSKPTLPASCRRLVRGGAEAGEACESDHICGGEAVCVQVSGTEEAGKCTRLAARAEPCVWSAGCQGGLFCVRGTCSPPRSAGQVCDGEQPWCEGDRCRVGTCAFGLVCRDGLCAPQGRSGTTCRMDEDCVGDLVCDSEGGCRSAPAEEVTQGSRAEPDTGPPICNIFRNLNKQYGIGRSR